jgi:hypothetical protein
LIEDDDDDQPLPPRPSHHLSTASQPRTHPDVEDESDQTADVRARDGGQPDYEPVASDNDDQPVQTTTPRHRPTPRKAPAPTIDQGQSSGQVAEIPSMRPAAQSGGFGPQQ